MMAIEAQGLGRQFNQHWVFRNLSFSIAAGGSLAILGANGAGKSTLVKLIAGQLTHTAGTLTHTLAGKALEPENLYSHLSWCAPYIEAYPALTVRESFALHFRFKACLLSGAAECLDALQLTAHAHKPLHQLSSGLLQRAYLGLALFSQSALLLLDEPTSHMDEGNAAFVLSLVDAHCAGRTLVLASNMEREYEAVKTRLTLS